jgi:cell wall-associated NlpC family hydrolase
MKEVLGVILSCIFGMANAANVPITRFPLTNYDQNVDHWVKPSSKTYDVPLVSADYQQKRLADFRTHWLAPWNPTYVKQELAQTNPDLVTVEQYFLTEFNNDNKQPDKLNYLENFRLAPPSWIQSITNNIDLDALKNIKYSTANNAIIVNNTHARLLPSNDPTYNDFTIAGQGYPFDNLSVSSIWQGTPAYVVMTTKDQRWDLVLTPAIIDWIPARDVAYVSPAQQHEFTALAGKQLGATIKTQSPILNSENRFDFESYVGSIYPITPGSATVGVWVTHRDADGNAVLNIDHTAATNIVQMPYAATPHHFANLYKTLINRPYGWGGMYFNNDCSQETKSIYAAFGIWLARNSGSQEQAGVVEDETSLPTDQRIAFLLKNGRPFMTEIYIGGHIIQFVGVFPNSNEPMDLMAMTYQNLWGLHPPTVQRRDVIGESVLLPLLTKYPEEPDDGSLAGGRYFKIIYLDQMPITDALSVVPLMQLMR